MESPCAGPRKTAWARRLSRAEKAYAASRQKLSREFARLYARSKPVHLNIPLSLGRQFYGENPVRASMYMQAMTGNATIPGGTPGGEHNGFGEHRTTLVAGAERRIRQGTRQLSPAGAWNPFPLAGRGYRSAGKI